MIRITERDAVDQAYDLVDSLHEMEKITEPVTTGEPETADALNALAELLDFDR